jgi:hypothetical protein
LCDKLRHEGSSQRKDPLLRAIGHQIHLTNGFCGSKAVIALQRDLNDNRINQQGLLEIFPDSDLEKYGLRFTGDGWLDVTPVVSTLAERGLGLLAGSWSL